MLREAIRSLTLGKARERKGVMNVAEMNPPPGPEVARNKPGPKPRPTLQQRRQVRAAYVKGEGSVRACAERYGVNVSTAQDWSEAEDWTSLRRTFETRAADDLRRATEPATPAEPVIQPPAATTQAGKLASVETQLQVIDRLLAECDNPDAMRKLWDAKRCALDAWALLTGFPKPGTRRQSRSGRGSISPPVPREPDLPNTESPPSQ